MAAMASGSTVLMPTTAVALQFLQPGMSTEMALTISSLGQLVPIQMAIETPESVMWCSGPTTGRPRLLTSQRLMAVTGSGSTGSTPVIAVATQFLQPEM